MLLHASPHACLSVSVSASRLSSVGLFCVCLSVSLYHQGICAVGPQLKPYPQDLFELQLGATCHAKIRDDVTHIVSTAKDTNKMHWAKQHSRHRVSPNWLFVSGRQMDKIKWIFCLYALDPAITWWHFVVTVDLHADKTRFVMNRFDYSLHVCPGTS